MIVMNVLVTMGAYMREERRGGERRKRQNRVTQYNESDISTTSVPFHPKPTWPI